MTREELLKRTMEDLAKRYVPGLYAFLYENDRPFYNVILKAENRVDTAFLTGTMEDLRLALRQYWRLHMQGIKQFEQKGRPVSNAQTRRRMEEERISA